MPDQDALTKFYPTDTLLTILLSPHNNHMTGMLSGAYHITRAVDCICVAAGGRAMEARDINANSMPLPPHQIEEMDPDVLLGADRGTSPTPVNLALLDSTLESRGSQSVDKIQSDFSALTVSYDTSGLETTGVHVRGV